MRNSTKNNKTKTGKQRSEETTFEKRTARHQYNDVLHMFSG